MGFPDYLASSPIIYVDLYLASFLRKPTPETYGHIENDKDLARRWKSVQFSSKIQDASSDSHVDGKNPASPHERESRVGMIYTNPAASELPEDLWSERLKNSRGGRFVGLGALRDDINGPGRIEHREGDFKSQDFHRGSSLEVGRDFRPGMEPLHRYTPFQTGVQEAQLRPTNESYNNQTSFAALDSDRKYRRKQTRPSPKLSKYDEDDEDRIARKVERKQQRKMEKLKRQAAKAPTPILLPQFISVSNLAAVLKVRISDFVAQMRTLGFEDIKNDHILDAETAGLIATEFHFEPITGSLKREELERRLPADDKSLLPSRPPVVTIMGHVDHGKTTILDWLRKSSIAATEHGGITQHIGAFSVSMPSGKIITFLDTPGHAAFLNMRRRGANVTDVVVLVVAADDGVKPQTVEAIKHSQDAKVPIIVAINKIDKEDAHVERVKQDLARHKIEIEDYGGDTQVVCVSGKTGEGMEQMEDAIMALADILDTRAETDGQVEGWILEASKKKNGRIATVLVSRGTLEPGNVIIAGSTWAKVRSLKNEAGVTIPAASPGTPAEIDGWREQPTPGDEVLQVEDEQRAKTIIERRLQVSERDRLAADIVAVNESRRLGQEKRALEKQSEAEKNTFQPSVTQESNSQPEIKTVYFLVKTDVGGSAEAVLDSISSLGNAEVQPCIIRSGVGPVNEFDVVHAAAAKACIVSFNNKLDPQIARLASKHGIRILNESIIYRVADEVRAVLSEHLEPNILKRVLGEAEIAKLFEYNIKGRTNILVAGCKVRNGVIGRGLKTRVMRGGEEIYDGMSPPLPLSAWSCTFRAS